MSKYHMFRRTQVGGLVIFSHQGFSSPTLQLDANQRCQRLVTQAMDQ